MRIAIHIYENTGHMEPDCKRVEIDGDGSIEHFLQTFIAALVAEGFALDTVKKIEEIVI